MAKKSILQKKVMSKAGKKSKSDYDILVTGDNSKDRFVYLEGISDEPANLREAWVNASRFWTVDLDGGSGNLLQYLNKTGFRAIDPCPLSNDVALSIYMLTRKKDKRGNRWCVGQAITAGEREYPSGKLSSCSPETVSLSVPMIIIDFNQGWLNGNKDSLPKVLKKRPYIVRTHDPRKDLWKEIRSKGTGEGIWFSPIQDMADGSLWFPGNWEDICKRLIDYLRDDTTLWSDEKNKWLHNIVIQISYDGALVVGPGMSPQGKLFIFKGDQPGSFAREDYGTVVAGGIVFVYSLANALLNKGSILDCVKMGLARVRKVVIAGYIGPKEGEEKWIPPDKTNLPIEQLKAPDTQKDIIEYNMIPPIGDWDTATAIITGSEETLREKTVFRLGDLYTASPDYARTLLGLSSRLANHLKNGKGVFSFSIFGSPGSGKSFVAEQVAYAADPSRSEFEQKLFNLSQLNEPSRLVDAFTKIQSIGLSGKIPFVLWDEFDTYYSGSKAGWLSSFLMPMQDASFFDGMTTQALGKCVFVFIGGVFKDDAEFNKWASSEGKTLKGPDFHSRLDSSLTVPSVDIDSKSNTRFDKPDPAKLVRAVMIRAFLRKQKKVTKISQEVLAYLLNVPLEHGVRSLQKIITASELSRTKEFQTYHLPHSDVLQLHVNDSRVNSEHTISGFLKKIKADSLSNQPPLTLEWRR
jgi:hypothetical protein